MERIRVQKVTAGADRVIAALDMRLRRIDWGTDGAPLLLAYPYTPRFDAGEGFGWTVKLTWKGCEPAVTIYQRMLTSSQIVVTPRYAGEIGPLSFSDKAQCREFEGDAYGRAADAALDVLKRLHHRELMLKERGTPA